MSEGQQFLTLTWPLFFSPSPIGCDFRLGIVLRFEWHLEKEDEIIPKNTEMHLTIKRCEKKWKKWEGWKSNVEIEKE